MFSNQPQHRKGAPQDLHAHALLMQGQKNIEQLATSEDFRYAQTEGKRPFGPGLMNSYTARIHRLCATDQKVLVKFEKVMAMLKSPAILFDPRIVLKVILLPRSNPVEKDLDLLPQESLELIYKKSWPAKSCS